MRSAFLIHCLSLALTIYAIPHPEGSSSSWLSKRTLPSLDLFPGDDESQRRKSDDRFEDPNHNPATILSSAPAVTPFSVSISSESNSSATPVSIVTAGAPTPTPFGPCYYDADPDGAEGLCPNLADGGWCDCGAAGMWQIMTGYNICGYTALPSTGSIVLSSTSCITSTVATSINSTIATVPAPATY